MPEMRLRPGLIRPGLHWGAHKPIAGFDGPLCGGGRKEEGTKGKGKDRNGEEGKGGEGKERREGEWRRGKERGYQGRGRPHGLKTPFLCPDGRVATGKGRLAQ